MNASVTKKPMSKSKSFIGMNTKDVTRCEMRVERCEGGCKIYCSCDDADDCQSMQAICEAMAGKMCCMSCTRNGEMVCHCCLSCGDCKCECERTDDGVCITCTSTDRSRCELIQAMCECIRRCQASDCECTLCFDETAVCCC